MSALKRNEAMGILEACRVLKVFAPVMQLKPVYFVVAVLSSFLIALFEGVSVGLLAPLMRGIIDKNFDFLKGQSFFKPVLNQFPELLNASSEILFLCVIAVIFLTTLIQNILSYLFGLYISYHDGIYKHNIENFIFERYLAFGKLYFDRASKGQVQKVLEHSARVVHLVEDLVRLLRRLFTGAVYFGLMVYISWPLTLFSLLTYPALDFSVKWLIQKVRTASRLQTELGLKLSRELYNILSCLTLVKAYSREEETRKKYRMITEKERKLTYGIAKKSRLVEPIQEMVTLVAILLMMCVVAFFFINEPGSNVAQYLLFLILAKKTIPHFSAFNEARTRIALMRPRIDKVLQLLTNDDKAIVPDGTMVLADFKGAFEFRNVTFGYNPQIPVLKNLSFKIPRGKMTALIGPTGAGKTTIVNLLMRFYDCPRGSIFVDGIDIREFRAESLRQHIALVSQQILLFNDTLRANLTYGRNGKNGEITDEKLELVLKKARLEAFVNHLPERFDTLIGDGGVRLSGGERQRVSIARALLKETDILFLDEATSALDSQTEGLIQEAIEATVRGRTSLVIAHRLSTVKHADQVLVIEDGQLVEQGSLKELLARKGAFYRYWERQQFY
ncbi:MAG: ABC transporter ATP-binding protein [Candidatus Omnitrophica bacterium]|nr:ABC transporter ATP-binding protein [Candidatus Omnitrophota bacterium]